MSFTICPEIYGPCMKKILLTSTIKTKKYAAKTCGKYVIFQTLGHFWSISLNNSGNLGILMPIWAVTDHFQSLSGIFNHPSWAISGPKLAAKRYKTRGICAFWGEIGMSPLRLTFEIRLGKNEREGGGWRISSKSFFPQAVQNFFFWFSHI